MKTKKTNPSPKIILIALLTLFAASASAKELKVETFNIGMARGFVHHAGERLPHLLEAIKKSDADVLCLQEVWSLADRKSVVKALLKNFQDVYLSNVYQTTTSSRPSCRPWEIFGQGKFVSCMQNQCGDANGDDFTDCIIDKCGNSLERLKKDNRECASALMAKVGKNPIISLLQLMNPFYRSGLYAYRGSNGLVLASKKRLKNKKLLDFSEISTLNRRQALKATVAHNGEDIQILCTHLSAKLKVPYTGMSRNWADENYTQALRVLEAADQAEKALIMGDFNCGLPDESANLNGELEATCALLENYLKDPAKSLRECTFCSSNTLNSPEDKEDVYIDHIYTKGLTVVASKIKYKRAVIIDTGNQTKEVNLSDHYGVQIIVD